MNLKFLKFERWRIYVFVFGSFIDDIMFNIYSRYLNNF